jgi:hypothetical protein
MVDIISKQLVFRQLNSKPRISKQNVSKRNISKQIKFKSSCIENKGNPSIKKAHWIGGGWGGGNVSFQNIYTT